MEPLPPLRHVNNKVVITSAEVTKLNEAAKHVLEEYQRQERNDRSAAAKLNLSLDNGKHGARLFNHIRNKRVAPPTTMFDV